MAEFSEQNFKLELRNFILDQIAKHHANPALVLRTAATTIFAMIARIFGFQVAVDCALAMSQEVARLEHNPDVKLAMMPVKGKG